MGDTPQLHGVSLGGGISELNPKSQGALRAKTATDKSTPLYLCIWLFTCTLHCTFNKLVNLSNCFLEFSELLEQINLIKGGVIGTSTYSWLDRSTGGNLGLRLVSEVGSGQSHGTES